MFSDVGDLREFYTSPLGQIAQRSLRAEVRALWPNLTGLSLLTVGYGSPLLRPFASEAERVLAFMPAQQGVVPWPREGANVSALADETRLPLQDASIDRIILLHAVECAPRLDAMMEEVWRVLTSGGRLIVVTPNRSGLWALSDSTPFGHGAAFSAQQIRRLLRDHLFIPERSGRALFLPPWQGRFWLGMAPLWETLGRRGLGALAGVHVIEASKQLYAPSGRRVAAKNRALPAAKTAPIGLRRS